MPKQFGNWQESTGGKTKPNQTGRASFGGRTFDLIEPPKPSMTPEEEFDTQLQSKYGDPYQRVRDVIERSGGLETDIDNELNKVLPQLSQMVFGNASRYKSISKPDEHEAWQRALAQTRKNISNTKSQAFNTDYKLAELDVQGYERDKIARKARIALAKPDLYKKYDDKGGYTWEPKVVGATGQAEGLTDMQEISLRTGKLNFVNKSMDTWTKSMDGISATPEEKAAKKKQLGISYDEVVSGKKIKDTVVVRILEDPKTRDVVHLNAAGEEIKRIKGTKSTKDTKDVKDTVSTKDMKDVKDTVVAKKAEPKPYNDELKKKKDLNIIARSIADNNHKLSKEEVKRLALEKWNRDEKYWTEKEFPAVKTARELLALPAKIRSKIPVRSLPIPKKKTTYF